MPFGSPVQLQDKLHDMDLACDHMRDSREVWDLWSDVFLHWWTPVDAVDSTIWEEGGLHVRINLW